MVTCPHRPTHIKLPSELHLSPTHIGHLSITGQLQTTHVNELEDKEIYKGCYWALDGQVLTIASSDNEEDDVEKRASTGNSKQLGGKSFQKEKFI